MNTDGFVSILFFFFILISFPLHTNIQEAMYVYVDRQRVKKRGMNTNDCYLG